MSWCPVIRRSKEDRPIPAGPYPSCAEYRLAPGIWQRAANPLGIVTLRRAVEKVVDVMRWMTTVIAIVVRCRIVSVQVLTKDSAVTGAQLCQHSSCYPWQCLYGFSNGQRAAIRQFWWAAFNGSSDRILVDAADGRLVAGVVERLFGDALLDARF